MSQNEINEQVFAKLKMKVLAAEQENAQTQEKKNSEMVDYICKTIKTEVNKAGELNCTLDSGHNRIE